MEVGLVRFAQCALRISQPMPALPEPGYDYRSSDISGLVRKSAAQEHRPDQGTGAARM